jgi:flagellar M-ring protein FliF
MAFIFLKKVAQGVVEAMNPPIPKYAGIDLEVEEEEVPESVRRQNEMIEKIESMTMDNPQSVSNIIKSWLEES